MNILGALASGVGDLAAAGSWFDKALACVESRPDLWKNRASIHRSCKEFEAAETCLRRTLALAPKDAQAHASLGAALRGLGRFAEAVQVLRRGHAP